MYSEEKIVVDFGVSDNISGGQLRWPGGHTFLQCCQKCGTTNSVKHRVLDCKEDYICQNCERNNHN